MFNTLRADSNLDPTVKRILQDMLLRGEAVQREPYHGIMERPEERFAPTSAETKRAQEMIRRLITQNPDYLDAAEGMARRSTIPFNQVVGNYMNPYQQHILDRMREENVRTFREGTMPELANTFTRMGQHGSSRHAQLAERAARQMQQDTAAQQNASLSKHYGEAYNMYNNDQNRNLNSADALTRIGLQRQLQGLTNAEAMGNIGSQNQAEQQRNLDWRYQQGVAQRNLPAERLREQAALFQGLPYERREFRREYEQPAQQMGVNGWGAAAPILAFLSQQARGR